jgi:hypothetical protein
MQKIGNEDIHYLHSSRNIVRVIESRTMGGARSTYEGNMRCTQGFGGET